MLLALSLEMPSKGGKNGDQLHHGPKASTTALMGIPIPPPPHGAAVGCHWITSMCLSSMIRMSIEEAEIRVWVRMKVGGVFGSAIWSKVIQQ